MSESRVILTICKDYDSKELSSAIERQFSLLGGLEKFISYGDTVLLKPNFIVPKPREAAAQTDPAVIIEVARLLKDFGAKPFVADSPAWSTAKVCAKVLGLNKPLKELSVPVKELDKPQYRRIGKRETSIGISSAALEADVIINLPKFKAHQQLVATFAVKNMFGCVCGKQKALWHFRKGHNKEDFCELLIDIYSFLNPAFSIIDAVTVMEGPGPIRGMPRKLGWVIGGTDPIACEVICGQLVGIEPENLPIVRTAGKIGFGCCDREKIRTEGDSFPEKICNDFVLPEQIPLRFSFLHVCKSITRQIILKAKAKMKT